MDHRHGDCKLISVSRTPCECLAGERYIFSSNRIKTSDGHSQSMSRSRSTCFDGSGAHEDEDNENENENQELLHVLALKPQLAARPRDNITFEGEMDLKTTFETSYEAVAKMRLDNWREYQLSIQRQRGHKLAGGSSRRNNSASPSGPRIKEPLPLASVQFETQSDHIDAPSGEQSHQRQRSVTNVRLSSEGSKAELNSMGALQDEKDSSKTERTNNIHAEKCENYSLIDPDLSPLIIYDANMNRLETVGLRKRSKYRPSTSLRTGTRGLFGDMPTESEPVKYQQDQEAKGSAKEDRANNHVDPKLNTDSSDMLELAQKEEQAANDEVYRVAHEGIHTEHPSSLSTSRQSENRDKLLRTCQNRNFDIFSGDYPEARQSVTKTKSLHSGLSPQAKQFYNNVFSESPDFILTTSQNLHDDSRPSSQLLLRPTVSDAPLSNGLNDVLRMIEPNTEEPEQGQRSVNSESDTCKECRCSRFDKDFQYIGSKAGHKYFIEKLFDE